MSRQTVLWLLLGIILLGVLFRSWHLTTRSLWFDESFSWRLIQFPFPEMITRAAADVHPPFYYVLLRGWAFVFGPSVLSLRAFSVAGAALTIAAAYLFTASAVRSRPAGLLASVFIALSGWQIAFAWEARMYTLGTALALLSSWLLVRATRRPTLAAWLYYAVAATLFAYTHYFAFFTLAAHAVAVAGYVVIKSRGRLGEMLHSRLFWQAGLAGILALLLYAPWIPVFLRQNSQVQSSYWVPAPGAWSIPDTFYRFIIPTAKSPWHTWPAAALTLTPLGLFLLVWGVLVLHRRASFGHWVTLLCSAFPVAAAVATSFLGQSLYQDRFLVFANIFVLVGTAAALARLRPPRFAVAGALCAALLAGTFVRYWRELDIPHRPGVRGAVSAVLSAHQADEPVLVGSSFVFFPVDYYARADRLPRPKLISASRDVVHFAGAPILTPEDVMTPAAAAALPAPRLWLVDTTGFGGSTTELPAPWRQISRQTFPEVFPHQGDIIVTEFRRR